jgi:cellulose synthase/poly-beta-1,6-N-acetylglucosamine synthase-like glycosyltransferase
VERTGAPWTLPALAGVAVVAVACVGLQPVVTVVGIGLEVLFIAFFLRHLAFAVAAMRSAPADLGLAPMPATGTAAPVTVLVACRNEAAVVDGLVASLLALDYPSSALQLVVVDDGSTDGSGAALAALAAAEPRLTCITRPPDARGGKAAALNAALPVVQGDVVVVFDADHQPRPDVIRRLVRHFADPSVGAVQGRCEIRNRDDSQLARLVSLDYLAGYLVNEYGRQALFELPAYGGANCAVRTTSLRSAGGWNEASVTEDTDLTLRLLLRGERVRYDVGAVDTEEGVVTLERFWRQRYRWARGHQQVWRDYRGAVWRTRHLSVLRKVEATMFLLVFHLPVASAVGLGVLLLWSAGLVTLPAGPDLAVAWTLLFLGPLLELGGGLLIARSARRDALALALFLPVFLVSIALCTKAWIDGVSGRHYGWVKTQRAADVGGDVAEVAA